MPKYLPSYRGFDSFEEEYEPVLAGNHARKKQAVPPKDQKQNLEQIAELSGLEGGFVTTYHPAQYEKIWLLSSLRSFYDEHLISDILAQVKGGKEASVYRCQANPKLGTELLAAKVYRPRQFRNLRNDKMYREGRLILTGEGRAVKKTDHRIMRAVGKKTAFGEQVEHSSWLLYEYTTLRRLFQAGGAVPEPYAVNDNSILMGYVGDKHTAAPPLNEIRLGKREARRVFDEALRNVELMLQQGFIHGDLSAYNILYWEGQITFIDFPQVTALASNRNAHFILTRDITRLCEYFAKQGLNFPAQNIANDLWRRYGVNEEEENMLLLPEESD